MSVNILKTAEESYFHESITREYPKMIDLYRVLPEEMDDLVVKIGQPRYRAEQLLRALYHESPKQMSDLHQIPSAMRDALVAAGYTIGSEDEVHRVVSEDGRTTKLLLKFDDQTLIETVLMQYNPSQDKTHPRSTVCVSTQVGCPMGCVFCATGQMGFEKNLKAEEIISQVLHFARLLRQRGEHVTNLVFMGMGEPLANYDEMVRAVRLLTHPRAFGLGQRSITISTVGVIAGIDRLADEDLQVKLAISLHAPNDELRKRLVPTAGPHSVEDLIIAAKRYFKKTGRRVTFEYALIDGINDSTKVASELAHILKGNGAHVNLIPMNPTAGGFNRPARKKVLAFQQILRNGDVNCTVRVEKGVEISAACGQLRTDMVEKIHSKP
ncbi:Ribosomal RNA large subunit methyltransferase N [Nitrosotalea devaniterrae]|uniref:Ribosomal RNA large subunit methyltransferase N n=1 Tax=Nitrosotalea devaniterrae TaxID=1078905 RepID=A0A128A3F2_9ARCH|nr:Ribosomal RNA large subunit methyltransferase N [Candidatus Nitrosotalea devanaterra]